MPIRLGCELRLQKRHRVSARSAGVSVRSVAMPNNPPKCFRYRVEIPGHQMALGCLSSPRRRRSKGIAKKGVCASQRKLRPAVSSLAVTSREASGGCRWRTWSGRHSSGCCDLTERPCSQDTSQMAWAELVPRAGEKFPRECPSCGVNIRLSAFITEPGPVSLLTSRSSAG